MFFFHKKGLKKLKEQVTIHIFASLAVDVLGFTALQHTCSNLPGRNTAALFHSLLTTVLLLWRFPAEEKHSDIPLSQQAEGVTKDWMTPVLYSMWTLPSLPGPSMGTGGLKKKKKEKKADSRKESEGDWDKMCDDSRLRRLSERGHMRTLWGTKEVESVCGNVPPRHCCHITLMYKSLKV